MSSIIRPRKNNQKPGRGQLFRAAESGSLTRVAVLLVLGHNPDRPDEYGFTPLQIAIMRHHCRVASLLARHSVDPDSKDSLGRTGMHTASLRNCVRCAKMLMQQRCDLNSKDNYSRTPLSLAIEEGNKDVAEVLINEGCDVNTVNGNGDNCLHIAAAGSHASIVEIIIHNSNCNVNLRNINGCTPLYLACLRWKSTKCTQTVKHLISAGADVNTLAHSIDDFEYRLSTPFEVAAQRGNFEVMIMLAVAGCDLSMVYKEWRVNINKSSYVPIETVFFKWLLNKSTNPKSLKQECRLAIRSHVRLLNLYKSQIELVSKLPLPRSLRNYIGYGDLEYLPDVEFPPSVD